MEEASNLQGIMKATAKLDELNPKLCMAILYCESFKHSNPPVYPDQKDACKMFNSNFETRCNLSKDEIAAIEAYTGSKYKCLNPYLWQKEKKSKDLDFFVTTMNQALDKLPNYEGFVIRGATLPKEVYDKHQVGKVITYDGFTSAATRNLRWGHQTFVIFSKTGKPIMDLSTQGHIEREVIFKAGTKFKILEISGTPKNEVYIMSEYLPNMSESERDSFEKEILKNIKNKKNDPSKDDGDAWSCPLKKKVNPKVIFQEKIPAF